MKKWAVFLAVALIGCGGSKSVRTDSPAPTGEEKVSGGASQEEAVQKVVAMVVSTVGQPSSKVKSVSVADFTTPGPPNREGGGESKAVVMPDGESFTDSVIEGLVNSGKVRVIDRSKLAKLLEEQQLGMSGVVDAESAKKAGSLLGADAILTGSWVPMGHMPKVSAQLVETVEGTIVGAVTVKLGGAMAGGPLLVQGGPRRFEPRQGGERFERQGPQGRLMPQDRGGRLREMILVYLTAPDRFLEETERNDRMERMKQEAPQVFERLMNWREELVREKQEAPQEYRRRLERAGFLREHPRELDERIQEMLDRFFDRMERKKERRFDDRRDGPMGPPPDGSPSGGPRPGGMDRR